MEEAPAHLPPSVVDLPMRQPRERCRSAVRYPEEAASEVPFVVVHPENAVKQLRCLEERLRQVRLDALCPGCIGLDVESGFLIARVPFGRSHRSHAVSKLLWCL